MKNNIILFIQRFISIVCAFAIAVFTIFYFVSVPVLAANSDWESLGEDAIALRDAYINYLKSWTSGDLAQVISSGWEVPSSWFKTLSDGSQCISPVDDWYYYITDGDDLGTSGARVHSGGGGSNSSGVHLAEDVSPVLPSESFQDIITQVDSFYSPSGDLDRISWKAAKYWDTFKNQRPSWAVERRFCSINLIENGKFVGDKDFIYLCPYYYDGTNYYYGRNILYLYFSGVVGEAELYYSIYNASSGTSSDPVKVLDCFSGQYMDIAPRDSVTNFLNLCFYDTYDNYEYYASYRSSGDGVACNNCGGSAINFGNTSTFFDLIKYDDTSSTFSGKSLYSTFNMVDWASTEKDYGFVYSDSYFAPSVGGYTDIDPEKIPANTTVTITGDTIGDYIYYDNTTGDTSTINEYITNNYTYITNNGSGTGEASGGGSGSSSGDVNVGGSVNVSGNVSVGGQIDINTNPIDINVNVNGLGSSGSITFDSSGAGVEFDEDVSLNNYYDWMNEQTSGFSGFMSQFFSWLPPEIVVMLCAGFACVILMRFLGR